MQQSADESRLARMIERMVTQRVCLEWAVRELAHLPGPVLEIGLGKGRTYDHLRRLAPDRSIFCFDRDVHATPDCIPPSTQLVLGDFRETLPVAMTRIGEPAALVHADVGSDNRARDARLAAQIGPLIAELLGPGGLLLSDRPMTLPDLARLELPEGVGRWQYFIYRRR